MASFNIDFVPLAFFLFLHHPLPLEISRFWFFFQIWVFIFYLICILCLAFDTNNFTNDSFFALNLESLFHEMCQFCFLFFIHVHDNQLVSIKIVIFHFVNAFYDLFFQGQSVVFFAVLKIDERRSDFVKKFINFLVTFYFQLSFCIFYCVSFFVTILFFDRNFYH